MLRRRHRAATDPGFGERGPQLLLESVKLERFKAVFQPAPLCLSPVTVLIGRNGSGKSTVLEALQWLDTAMRYDAITACEKYSGIHDLLNIRSRGKNTRYFRLALQWGMSSLKAASATAKYELRVNESPEARPLIHSETLSVSDQSGFNIPVIETPVGGTRGSAGRRVLFGQDSDRRRTFDEPDRLALSRLSGFDNGSSHPALEAVRNFWDRAVFLRLSPQRIAQGSSARRRSFDPLLDEEGRMLPALLNELQDSQRKALVEEIKSVLPDVRGISVTQTGPRREEDAVWSIREKMPTGFAGKGTYEIPASMLSEGTRRLTAILALLIRRPPPSLLCIEELENGLDPWTALEVLKRIQSASKHGTQTMVTTHSPWLLDSLDLDSIRLVRRRNGNTRYSAFRSESGVQAFMESIPPGARFVNLVDSE